MDRAYTGLIPVYRLLTSAFLELREGTGMSLVMRWGALGAEMVMPDWVAMVGVLGEQKGRRRWARR